MSDCIYDDKWIKLITITCPCNVFSLMSHFYIAKPGCAGNTYFSFLFFFFIFFFASNIYYGYTYKQISTEKFNCLQL